MVGYMRAVPAFFLRHAYVGLATGRQRPKLCGGKIAGVAVNKIDIIKFRDARLVDRCAGVVRVQALERVRARLRQGLCINYQRR